MIVSLYCFLAWTALLRRVEEEVPLAVVRLDAAQGPGAVLADHQDHVMVLAEAASVTHTHQGQPPLCGLAVHLRLQVLTHAARGLVEDSQPRASVEHPRPGQPLLLAGTQLAVPGMEAVTNMSGDYDAMSLTSSLGHCLHIWRTQRSGDTPPAQRSASVCPRHWPRCRGRGRTPGPSGCRCSGRGTGPGT